MVRETAEGKVSVVESKTSTGSRMASQGTKRLGNGNLDALAATLVYNDHNRPCRYVRGDNDPESSPTEMDRAKVIRE